MRIAHFYFIAARRKIAYAYYMLPLNDSVSYSFSARKSSNLQTDVFHVQAVVTLTNFSGWAGFPLKSAIAKYNCVQYFRYSQYSTPSFIRNFD